jgi:hypothetical protein
LHPMKLTVDEYLFWNDHHGYVSPF